MNRDSVLPKEVIEPLCQPFSTQADWLLDLYELTQRPNRKAGQCLKCFYALLEVADDRRKPALEPLKRWIEQNMEISVKANDHETASLPVSLDTEDFDSFCERMIHSVRRGELLHFSHLELQLQYKAPSQAA